MLLYILLWFIGAVSLLKTAVDTHKNIDGLSKHEEEVVTELSKMSVIVKTLVLVCSPMWIPVVGVYWCYLRAKELVIKFWKY